jgi:hypothetical protein
MTLLTALLCALAGAATAQADTIVKGTLAGNQTWTPAGSPYVVTADATVAAGGTLTVEPGTTIELDESVVLTVAGDLDAQGTAPLPVVFRDHGGRYWRGRTAQLKLRQPATLDHVVVDRLNNVSSTAALDVRHSAFRFQSELTLGDADGTVPTGGVTIASSSFYRSAVSLRDVPASRTVAISGNRMGQSGISSQHAMDGTVVITGNAVDGIGLQGWGAGTFDIRHNRVASYECCGLSGTITFRDNNLVTSEQPTIWTAFDAVDDVSGNWWGTTDDATIASRIHTVTGSTIYSPFLTAADPVATALDAPGSPDTEFSVPAQSTTGTVEVTGLQAPGASSDPFFECQYERVGAPEISGWVPCENGVQFYPQENGTYTFSARAIDDRSVPDPTPATHSVDVAVVPFDTEILSAPPARVRDRATVTFAADRPGAGFQCQRDSAGWIGCASPYTFTGLTNGDHTLSVRAVASQGSPWGGGFPDPTPASVSVSADTTPPNTTLRNPPSGVQSQDVALAFDTSEPASSECRADSGDWTPCTSPHRFAGLGDGPHRLFVRSTDLAGNVEPDPAALDVTLDMTTPPLAAVTGPALATSGQAVTFNASGSADRHGGAIAGYCWAVDGGACAPTGATFAHAFADPGVHTVSVVVTDHIGLTAGAQTTVEVRRSSLPGLPGVSINDGAQFTNDPHVTLSVRWPLLAASLFASNDGGFRDPLQVSVADEIPWTLDSSGPERLPKTIYVRFSGGLAGPETYQDDIILDETRPTIQAATVQAPAGAAAAAARTRVAVKARDNASGVRRVQFAMKKSRPAKARAFKRSLTVTGRRPVFVRVRDGAGNLSRWHKLTRRR